LKALLNSSIMVQLLQHAPPAALTAEQEAQLLYCSNLISLLAVTFHEAPSLEPQLVDAMLKQQAACSIGSLVTWVQQQPEQQLLDLRVVAAAGHQGSRPMSCAAGSATTTLWAAGVQLLGCFAISALKQIDTDGAAGCSRAGTLTQQLEVSGKACSRNCKCAAQ
jgi:hypothetical protein